MKIRMLAGADGTDNGMVDPNSARKPNGGKKMLPCHQHNDSADNLNMFLCVCVCGSPRFCCWPALCWFAVRVPRCVYLFWQGSKCIAYISGPSTQIILWSSETNSGAVDFASLGILAAVTGCQLNSFSFLSLLAFTASQSDFLRNATVQAMGFSVMQLTH